MRVPDSCAVCGAVAASDQDYCLECGERILPGPQAAWAPIALIAVVLAVALVGLIVAYRGIVHEADREAAAPSPVSRTPPSQAVSRTRAGSAKQAQGAGSPSR